MAGKKINLTDQLKKYFGFDTFKGNQEAIIQNLLAGNDTFVLMPTINQYNNNNRSTNHIFPLLQIIISFHLFLPPYCLGT